MSRSLNSGFSSSSPAVCLCRNATTTCGSRPFASESPAETVYTALSPSEGYLNVYCARKRLDSDVLDRDYIAHVPGLPNAWVISRGLHTFLPHPTRSQLVVSLAPLWVSNASPRHPSQASSRDRTGSDQWAVGPTAANHSSGFNLKHGRCPMSPSNKISLSGPAPACMHLPEDWAEKSNHHGDSPSGHSAISLDCMDKVRNVGQINNPRQVRLVRADQSR